MKQKRKTGRKLLGFLLTLVMVVGLMPGMRLTAYAAWSSLTDSNTNWIDDLEAQNTVTINDNVTVTGNTWLHCNHDVTVNGSLTVNARLVVYGPGKLYVNGNVIINSGQTLKVYGGDGTRDGVLVAKVSSGDCITGSGTLEVAGCVTASGGENGVGIKGVILSYGTLYGSDAAAINEENKKDSPYQKPGLRNSVDYESHRYMYVDDGYVDAQTLSAGDTISAESRGIKNCTSITLQAGGYATESDMPGTETTTVEAISNRVYFYNGKIDDMGCGEYSPYANGKAVNFWQVVSNSEGALVLTGYEISHTHNFTYSADSDTITATCGNDGCDLTDSKAILTIAAPTLTTYGGTGSAAATLTGLDAFNTATDKTIAAMDIKYVGRDGTTYTESTTAPSNAGKYTASITVEEKTASVNYEIAKADPTAPTSLTATYGQTLANVTLPDGWAWTDSTQNVGSVGSNTFKANFAGDSNYNAASDVDVTVTVGKAANPATVASTVTVMRGGNTVDLVSNVTLNGATGEVTYAIAGDANGCSLNGSVLTSGENPGSVTVNVSVAEDNNYDALAATLITVTVSDKGTQTINASDVTVTYGDTDKKVEATTDGNGAISYAVKDGSAGYIDVDASTGALTIKKVGTATVIVTAAETNTYEHTAKEVTVTINKANAVEATVTANNRTYDGTDKPLVNVTGEATGGEMQYALGTKDAATEEYTTSIPSKTDAGTYYVWYKVVGDANHNSTEPTSVEAKINPVDKTDLNTAIEEAEAYYESIKEDDVYAQVAEALKKAIDEAKKYTNDNVAEEEVKEAIDTIKAAKVAAEEGKKEADDTVVANEVADAINALPSSDKIATTDKAAIEAARKAYDALTDDQKAKVPAETLKKLEAAEKALADAEKNTSDDDKKDEEKPDYKNEWVDGQWYGANGNTEYKAKASWKQNDKGWWYEDTDGWYPVSQWQMIDGKWYYFTADGYMDYSEYREGCWLGSDGAWDETYGGGHWMQGATGWWYVDSTGWYPVNRYLWVDGVQYWFNANGYWE